jgi:hypothetical protein
MDMTRTTAQTTMTMDHLLTASMGITRITRMHVRPTVIGVRIISMTAFLLASVPGLGGDLDQGFEAGFTISMTSVASAASGETAFETSGTKVACEAGGAVTPTVVVATEGSVTAVSEAEHPVGADSEDSVAAASVAERPVVAEGSVAADSEAERTVVVASEAEAAAATEVDTAKTFLKEAAGKLNYQPLFSFTQLRIDCNAPRVEIAGGCMHASLGQPDWGVGEQLAYDSFNSGIGICRKI